MLLRASRYMQGRCCHPQAAAASSLPANENIPYHPTGCRYVRKSPDGKLSFSALLTN